MNEKLLLTDNLIDSLSSKIDEAFNMKEIIKNPIIGAAAEALDGKISKMVLNFSNVRVSQYIPDEYKDEIQLALTDVLDGDNDYSVAISNAIEVIDQLKDKLKVSDFVKSMIDSFLEIIKAALLVILDKKE